MFEAFLSRPDLESRLAEIDAEARALGLTREAEIPFELPPRGSGRRAVVRGFTGQDAAGRPVHAVRVATQLGVVLALGPLDVGDLDRSPATELIPALGDEGVAFTSGSDLNGDGKADVIVKNEAGHLEVWHIDGSGSGPYPVTMLTPPTGGAMMEGSPHLALTGHVPVSAGDPIAPVLEDRATFVRGEYTSTNPTTRAWHARLASVPLSTNVSDALRLRGAVEHAWHAILAGEPKDRVIRDLQRESVPPPLRASFEAHLRMLTTVTPR